MLKAWAVAVAVALPLGGAERAWTRVASPHFEVYTTAGARTARDVLAYFEDIRVFLDGFLRLPPSTRPPAAIVVFGTDAEYAPYRAAPAATAFFQPARERDFIVIGRVSDAEPVVVHEYTHLAFERLRVRYPVWLAEGLADFFSTLRSFDDRVVLGTPPAGRMGSLATGRLLPLPALLAVTHDSPEYGGDHTGIFYAESWALTHMLVPGEQYQPSVDRWLAAVAGGASADAAWRTVYGKTTAQVAEDLQRYVRRGYFRQLSAPPARSAARVAAAPEPVDAFEADMVLADMLAAGQGRQTAARAAYDALVTARPDDPRPLAGRGRLEVRLGATADATRWLTRAVDRGSTDAMAWAELGRLISSSDPDRADAMFARALALAPDAPAVRVRAGAHALQRGRASDALAALAPIREVPSDLRFEFYQVVAHARLMQGEFGLATDAAARVADAASSPDERAFARALQRQVAGPPGVTHTISGRLIDMDCSGAIPILTVEGPDGLRRLALDDRRQVLIAGGGSADLDCGRQARVVTVGYDAANPPPGTAGRIRFLDLRGSFGY